MLPREPGIGGGCDLEGLSELGARLLVPDEPGLAMVAQRGRPKGAPVAAQPPAHACRLWLPRAAPVYPAEARNQTCNTMAVASLPLMLNYRVIHPRPTISSGPTHT